jgi:hypothetical protein
MSVEVNEQWQFTRHTAMLIAWAESEGFVLTAGEAARPIEMQRIYVKDGRSKTMDSRHLDRRAHDWNVFVRGQDGKLRLATYEEIKPLGKFWESLDPKNRWGGSWRGLVEAGRSRFIDAPHFERQR